MLVFGLGHIMYFMALGNYYGFEGPFIGKTFIALAIALVVSAGIVSIVVSSGVVCADVVSVGVVSLPCELLLGKQATKELINITSVRRNATRDVTLFVICSPYVRGNADCVTS